MDKKNFVIDQSIFRDYDIRGIYPSEINEKTFFFLGRALAVYLKVSKIAVGRDTRLSSPSLFNALVSGIMEQGTDVIDLGLISTEMNYFASGFYRFPANVIVSASHNPPEYNGLKIVKKDVVPLHGSFGIPEIKDLAVRQIFPSSPRMGNMSNKSILKDWLKHLLTFIDIGKLKNLKVVIDAGNGMGGISWRELKSELPLEIIGMFFEPDGNFPNHLPDPLQKINLKALKNKIKTEKADLGFAIDGDADRLFVIDDRGIELSGSTTAAMLAEHLISLYGPNPVLYSVTCSRTVPEIILKGHGQAIRTRVGHSFIKMEMKKSKALFAGEHSGHYYFRKNYNADSSTVAGLLFLQFLSMKNMPLSVLRKDYETYYQSGEINYQVDYLSDFFHNLLKAFSGKKIDQLDGVTVESENWWFNIRSSKTEPLIRLNLEARSRELLSSKLNFLDNLIKKLGGRIKNDSITNEIRA